MGYGHIGGIISINTIEYTEKAHLGTSATLGSSPLFSRLHAITIMKHLRPWQLRAAQVAAQNPRLKIANLALYEEMQSSDEVFYRGTSGWAG